MTVKDVITTLSGMDPDLEIYYEDTEWGPTRLNDISITDHTTTERKRVGFWDSETESTTKKIVVLE